MMAVSDAPSRTLATLSRLRAEGCRLRSHRAPRVMKVPQSAQAHPTPHTPDGSVGPSIPPDWIIVNPPHHRTRLVGCEPHQSRFSHSHLTNHDSVTLTHFIRSCASRVSLLGSAETRIYPLGFASCYIVLLLAAVHHHITSLRLIFALPWFYPSGIPCCPHPRCHLMYGDRTPPRSTGASSSALYYP